jgi:hypothetical protein
MKITTAIDFWREIQVSNIFPINWTNPLWVTMFSQRNVQIQLKTLEEGLIMSRDCRIWSKLYKSTKMNRCLPLILNWAILITILWVTLCWTRIINKSMYLQRIWAEDHNLLRNFFNWISSKVTRTMIVKINHLNLTQLKHTSLFLTQSAQHSKVRAKEWQSFSRVTNPQVS